MPTSSYPKSVSNPSASIQEHFQGSPLILVVDDEPHMQRFLQLCMIRGSFNVITASNGKEAILLAMEKTPDLIIMDVSMPEMDGLTALQNLRENPKTHSIPIILVTARGHALTQQEAQYSGADLFITKPFSPTFLLEEALRLTSPESSLTQNTPG